MPPVSHGFRLVGSPNFDTMTLSRAAFLPALFAGLPLTPGSCPASVPVCQTFLPLKFSHFVWRYLSKASSEQYLKSTVLLLMQSLLLPQLLSGSKEPI